MKFLARLVVIRLLRVIAKQRRRINEQREIIKGQHDILSQVIRNRGDTLWEID